MIRFIQVSIIIVLLITSVNGQTFSPSNIKIVWKDSTAIPYMLFKNVQKAYPNATFMINGGKSTKSHHPIGLYVENGKRLSPIKTIQNPKISTGVKPSGVFVINNGKAYISNSMNQGHYNKVDYAIQSEPILIWNGKLNRKLPRGKTQMRNGVGIKKDGMVYFACLKMDYREFAQHFLDQGCISALQLDDEQSEIWQKEAKPSYSRYATIFVVE
jgi:uncharacterized protein YigE (DUF2233 family)